MSTKKTSKVVCRTEGYDYLVWSASFAGDKLKRYYQLANIIANTERLDGTAFTVPGFHNSEQMAKAKRIVDAARVPASDPINDFDLNSKTENKTLDA